MDPKAEESAIPVPAKASDRKKVSPAPRKTSATTAGFDFTVSSARMGESGKVIFVCEAPKGSEVVTGKSYKAGAL